MLWTNQLSWRKYNKILKHIMSPGSGGLALLREILATVVSRCAWAAVPSPAGSASVGFLIQESMRLFDRKLFAKEQNVFFCSCDVSGIRVID